MSLIRPNEQLVTELFAVYVKQQQTWTSHASRARLLAFGDLPSRFTWVSCKLSVGKSLHVFIGQRWISFRNKAQLSSQSLTCCLPSQFSRLILPRYTPNLLVKSLSEKYYLARKESEFEPLSFFFFSEILEILTDTNKISNFHFFQNFFRTTRIHSIRAEEYP